MKLSKTFIPSTLIKLSALCFAAGALSSFAMAPTLFWPVLFVGLSLLYMAISSAASSKVAFLYGFIFAFGYFLLSLSWVGNALLVEGNPYKWALPLAICGLPLILAPFTAAACWASKRLFDLKSLGGFFGFVALLSTSEWLRGHIFTGFPWNLFGYTWGDTLEIAQVAALGNIYHLTALTIFWAASAGFVLLKAPSKKERVIILSISVLTLALSYGFGAWRLNSTPTTYHEDVQIRLVQPNINQADKWNPSKMSEHFFSLIRLSYPENAYPENTQDDKTTYIIWPETALSYHYLQDKTSMSILSQALQSYGGETHLLTGALRKENGQYFNSLLNINKNGDIQNTYNKHHLVPFGEYIPFQKFIPLAPVTNFSGFQGGAEPEPVRAAQGLRYLPLICYEVIFPRLSHTGNAPDFIVNVTNDAWYGFSAGPHQHLTQAKFRAIETGTPLIRAANTGISAVIDPLGRIVQHTSLFEESARTSPLPKPHRVFKKPTLFENASFTLLMIGFFLLAMLLKPAKKYQ